MQGLAVKVQGRDPKGDKSMRSIDSSGDVLKLVLGVAVTAVTAAWFAFVLLVWIFS